MSESVKSKSELAPTPSTATPATLSESPIDTPETESEIARAAIKRCMAAWSRVYNANMEGEEDVIFNREYACREAAGPYCAALPPLTTRENIRAFIACVAQGVLIEAIPPNKSGSLLYAAQVALSSVNRAPRRR